MRPVARGENDKIFSKYQQARDDLIDRLGEYCSYCEVRLETGLAVEHVQPKSHKPGLLLDWNNFLLACGRCNSSKGSKDIQLDDYLWPDMDNTFVSFVYTNSGAVQINPEMDEQQHARAENTLALFGFEKRNEANKHNIRYSKRMRIWNLAVRKKEQLGKNNNEDFKGTVVELAFYSGYWSIWMTVFKDDPDMRGRLIEKFPGTCGIGECFDIEGRPIPRS